MPKAETSSEALSRSREPEDCGLLGLIGGVTTPLGAAASQAEEGAAVAAVDGSVRPRLRT